MLNAECQTPSANSAGARGPSIRPEQERPTDRTRWPGRSTRLSRSAAAACRTSDNADGSCKGAVRDSVRPSAYRRRSVIESREQIADVQPPAETRGAGGRRRAPGRDSGKDGEHWRAALRRGPQDGERRARPCARCPACPSIGTSCAWPTGHWHRTLRQCIVPGGQLSGSSAAKDWTRTSDTLKCTMAAASASQNELCNRCAVR